MLIEQFCDTLNVKCWLYKIWIVFMLLVKTVRYLGVIAYTVCYVYEGYIYITQPFPIFYKYYSWLGSFVKKTNLVALVKQNKRFHHGSLSLLGKPYGFIC